MEDINVPVDIDDNDSPQLSLDDIAKEHLLKTSKWMNFLSIIGFIGIGLIVLAAFFVGSFFSSLPFNELDGFSQMPTGFGFLFSTIYLLMALLYFFPTLFLYQYASKLRSALDNSDSFDLRIAFSKQKSLYRFWGIFTIIVLGFYAITILLTLIGVLLF